MKELSLHILDIVENSIKAEATLIEIDITVENNMVDIQIEDNGKGMSEEFLNRVIDPFTTTRTTRQVGLGIPLLKQAAEQTGGFFNIKSELGKGTKLNASFQEKHIDRVPMGNLAETIVTLISDDFDLVLKYRVYGNEFVFDTREVKQELGEDISINEPAIISFVKSMLKENIEETNGNRTI